MLTFLSQLQHGTEQSGELSSNAVHDGHGSHALRTPNFQFDIFKIKVNRRIKMNGFFFDFSRSMLITWVITTRTPTDPEAVQLL